MKIKSQNMDWGFFGTIQRNYNFSEEAAARLFDASAQMLIKKLKLREEPIREFLDGRYGRHFADELSFHGAKEGMTEAEFINVVRKFLIKADDSRTKWVENEIRRVERSV